jgi:hypothetical protein
MQLSSVAAEKGFRFVPALGSVRQLNSLVFQGQVLYWLVRQGDANRWVDVGSQGYLPFPCSSTLVPNSKLGLSNTAQSSKVGRQAMGLGLSSN